jgi:UDP-N-acetylmuramoyl-L-alanyl-D-glutamate--2,6-diaminopimelate ligase
VLLTLRAALRPTGRLHAVLGVLGTPDRDHLDALGRTARELADSLILTAGSFRRNPRLHTIAGLSKGAGTATGATVTIVPLRRAAFRAAARAAGPSDVVAILGRGNRSEAVSDQWIDDRMVLRELALEGGL